MGRFKLLPKIRGEMGVLLEGDGETLTVAVGVLVLDWCFATDEKIQMLERPISPIPSMTAQMTRLRHPPTPEKSIICSICFTSYSSIPTITSQSSSFAFSGSSPLEAGLVTRSMSV